MSHQGLYRMMSGMKPRAESVGSTRADKVVEGWHSSKLFEREARHSTVEIQALHQDFCPYAVSLGCHWRKLMGVAGDPPHEVQELGPELLRKGANRPLNEHRYGSCKSFSPHTVPEAGPLR